MTTALSWERSQDKAVIYSLRVAFQSLWRERWINLLSMLSIAMGMVIITTIIAAVYNIDLFTKNLPERFSVMAYLKDSVSENDSEAVIASIRKHGLVEKTKYISKADALKELRVSLKDADYILEGLGENPLPASIEIRLKKESIGPESVKQIASYIKKINGIDDVQYGEKFLDSIHSFKMGIQTMGLILTIIMTAGTIFICYSTVKILFYRRKEEIETLKLLGATRGFIRRPFLIEGGAIGISGGIISMVVALGFYFSVFIKLSITVPIVRSIVILPETFLLLPATGLLLGIAGAFIAIGRIKY